MLWLKIFLASSLAFGEAGAFAMNQCMQDLVDECRADASATQSQLATQMGTTGNTQQDSQRTGAALQSTGLQMGAQAKKCDERASECEKCSKAKDPKNDPEVKKCQEAVAAQATTMKEQSAEMGSKGGDMGAIAGLMGAALGAAMGMMMAKKNQKPPPPPPPIATGALQLNGSLNCQMQDSYRYEDCAPFLTTYCQNQAAAATAGTTTSTPMTGTVISQAPGVLPATPDCASFNANYCSSSVSPSQPYGMQRQDGAITQVNMAGTGGGLGTQYCARTISSQWCSDPSRSMCPSCRQQEVYSSATCAANPAACITQTSPQQIQAAQTDPVCSGDPLYTPGSPYAVAGTLPTNLAGTTGTTNTAPGGGLPVVVLPASTGNGADGTQQIPGKSYASAGQGGVREGRAPGSAGGASGGGFGAGSIRTSSAHAHASANELIAAGGVIVASGKAAPVRGPASDIEGQHGPSLFTTSSLVIRQHCEAGKLNNCP